MKSAKLPVWLPVVLILSLLAGCAGHSKELLGENYKTMNNEQLLEYFYRLNDEI